MALLETQSGPIAYDERGDGQPVVMLSSGSHDRHDFDALRDLLPSGFRSIAPDWPAHGESPPGQGPATAMRFADIAEELVEQLAPSGAIVVGNSVGGFAAARLAIRRPELVRALVLVDSGGFLGRPPQVRAFCALMSQPRFLRAIYPWFANRYMRPRSGADRRVRDVGIATTRADPGLRAVSELWRSFASPAHDLRAEAPSISAPTLIVWGKRDPVIPLKIGQRLAAAIPAAELAIFDTGHAPQVSDPEGFSARLIPFAEAALQGSAASKAR
ncbi:MAG TPA: alpha/beta hydrolase [Solirubrobacterales bacterium]|nr:alpha/beta hydrolase [Solirubrobacterales bacterium]